jgi:hypothetical protein
MLYQNAQGIYILERDEASQRLALPVAWHPDEGWWVGRDDATLPEPTSSHTNCLKTRRLPPPRPRRTLPGFGCTLCWAGLVHDTIEHFVHKLYSSFSSSISHDSSISTGRGNRPSSHSVQSSGVKDASVDSITHDKNSSGPPFR